MAAKDWAPLQEALWRHVRKPIQCRFGEEWARIKQGGTIDFDRLQKLARRGKISETDTRGAALWYALVYACPHFDALTALMRKRVFWDRVQRALERDQTTRAQRDMIQRILSRFLRHRYSLPRVLHIDFGCGPGTASWTAIKLLSGRATVVTVGHDHNRHMIKLARTITADVAKPQRNITNLFFLELG